MEIQNNLYTTVCRILTIDFTFLSQKENQKIYKAVSVLHKEYLVSSAREARSIINKDKIENKYNLMISIYNRKLKEHQTLILLIQLFEIAMRTKDYIYHTGEISKNYLNIPRIKLILLHLLFLERCLRVNLIE